jgi:DNA-binding NarL/FixJ family response regulator
MTGMCRILLADDHDVVRRGLRTLLESKPGFEVCGEARTGREAVAKTQELKPDVIVMDISMPELNGLDATLQIRKAMPQAKVVIITQHDSEELVRQVANIGARGYVLKTDSEKDLVNAVTAVCQHQSFVNPRTRDPLAEGMVTEMPMRQNLTGREREVIQLLAEGKSSKEVATTLKISVKTAETHRANIMRKLNLHSVSDLVRYAIRNNIAQV